MRRESERSDGDLAHPCSPVIALGSRSVLFISFRGTWRRTYKNFVRHQRATTYKWMMVWCYDDSSMTMPSRRPSPTYAPYVGTYSDTQYTSTRWEQCRMLERVSHWIVLCHKNLRLCTKWLAVWQRVCFYDNPTPRLTLSPPPCHDTWHVFAAILMLLLL